MNVQVPFFFKYAVDYFNKLPDLSTPENTIITIGTALLLGCMLYMFPVVVWLTLLANNTYICPSYSCYYR